MYSEGVGRVICPDNVPVLLGRFFLKERPVFTSNVEVEWIRQTDGFDWEGETG